MVLVFCTLYHGDIHLHKVSRKYLKQFSRYRVDTNILQKSLCSVSCLMMLYICVKFHQLWILCSARCLMVFYTCEKFHNNISNGFQLTERTREHNRNGYAQCSKDNNSKSRQTRVTVYVFCMSFHSALHLCEVS